MQNTTENPWDESAPKEETPRVTKSSKAKKIADEVLNVPAAPVTPAATNVGEYDIDGLMTDFPTATELERFVYDETGIVLQLKGRANKLKYQVAMDVLNGQEVDQKYVGGDNPYIDRTELVPIDPIKEPPARSALLPDRSQVQNVFVSNVVPHPEDEARAQDKKVSMLFRKYNNGMIDPRTGEQTIVREDGTMTPQGKRLRAMMQTFKVNRSNQWEVWIDREFVSLNDAVAHNPWDLKA